MTTILTTIGDLAAGTLDSGHLAGVVRDALATHHLAYDNVATVLRPYAHRYAAPLGDGLQIVERLLDEAGLPASTVRLGGYALNRSRQQGTALVDTSTQNTLVAKAMEPLLHSPAFTEMLQRMHDTFGPAAAAAVATSQLRIPVDALNASLAELMAPLLRSSAIEESTWQIRETLCTAAAAGFPNAALQAIVDQLTAQSPMLETLIRAIAATNPPAASIAGELGSADTSPAASAAPSAGSASRQRAVAAPEKVKVNKGRQSRSTTMTSTPP